MSLEIASVAVDESHDGRARVEVGLANGKSLALYAASMSAPAGWTQASGFHWGPPNLWVSDMADDSIRGAVAAMAADLGGYWLSYCSRAARERPEETPAPVKVPHVELGDKDKGTAVVQAVLADGREFSILACTPAWFSGAMATEGLPYYWGPSVLFLSKLEKAPAKRAVDEMGTKGDRWLCLYDTPRTTLAKVLADFKTRQKL